MFVACHKVGKLNEEREVLVETPLKLGSRGRYSVSFPSGASITFKKHIVEPISYRISRKVYKG